MTLLDGGDRYNWEVATCGPPNTYDEGGYFQARLKSPIDFLTPSGLSVPEQDVAPQHLETGDCASPCSVTQFVTPRRGELPSARWDPTQNPGPSSAPPPSSTDAAPHRPTWTPP